MVRGLSAVNRLHEQSMAENKGDVSLVTEIGGPVPAEDCLAGANKAVTIGRQGEVEFLIAGAEFTVQEFASSVVEDAELKCSGMEVNASLECMCVL
jgi:hypothetical protein